MITLLDISKEYNTKKQTIKALKNVNLTIKEGESLAILGLNGSGKSTLVKTITGIIKPTSGEVFIDQMKPQDGKEYRKKFSVVYQNNGLDFYLSVFDNLKINGFIYGLRGKELKNAIYEIMAVMGLEKYKNASINELSGGYAKRVQVAKSLMVDTPILILDEPTQGMDPMIKNDLFQIIEQKRKQGKIVIYTTQILDEVEKICNYVAILKSGTLLGKDTIQNMKERFSKNYVIEIIVKDSILDESFYTNNVKELLKKYKIQVQFFEFHELKLKLITNTDIKQSLAFIDNIKDSIDMQEVYIKKASLEEILIGIEKGDTNDN